MKPLPVLYVYDHCPFCIRVRFALGVKNIKHDIRFLMNDDADTPTSLVGKKIAPIWTFGEQVMPESLDIIKMLDADERFGPTNLIRPASGRTDLKEWQSKHQNLWRILQRPRYVHSQSVLPEFQQQDARDYFKRGHFVPLDGHDKASFKALSKEEIDAYFDRAIAMTAESIPKVLREEGRCPKGVQGATEARTTLQANEALRELDALIHSEECASPGGISYDDVDLWARLRSVSIVKGVTM
eukprot:scaffold870_cov268-Pinguiococcus_pyrenoidosus.AAC.36